MTTAISIPDPLFNSAETLARQQGLTFNELNLKALTRFMQEQTPSNPVMETTDTDNITERLNAIYSKLDNRLDPVWAEIQARSIPYEDQHINNGKS